MYLSSRTWGGNRFLCSPFFEIDILKFQKKKKGCSQLHTLWACKFLMLNTLYCILKRKDKLDKSWNMFPDLEFFLFLPRTKYNVFRNKILHTGRINHSLWHRLHFGIFIEFFQTLKFECFEVWKNGLHGARPPKRRSRLGGHFII
jgi:hypothetical protein